MNVFKVSLKTSEVTSEAQIPVYEPARPVTAWQHWVCFPGKRHWDGDIPKAWSCTRDAGCQQALPEVCCGCFGPAPLTGGVKPGASPLTAAGNCSVQQESVTA